MPSIEEIREEEDYLSANGLACHVPELLGPFQWGGHLVTIEDTSRVVEIAMQSMTSSGLKKWLHNLEEIKKVGDREYLAKERFKG